MPPSSSTAVMASGLDPGASARGRFRVDARDVMVAVFLGTISVAAYGKYIFSGGFYADDWGLLDAYRNLPDHGFWTSVHDSFETMGSKPILAFLLALPPSLFGNSVVAWLTMSVVLAAVTSLCWYAALRTLGLPRVHSAAVAALTLVAPWTSSVRLWATASLNNVAVVFFLLGLIVALRSARHAGAEGRRRHALALVLYVLSVLTYEIAATAALAAGCLYLTRAPRREALLRWGCDVIVVGVATAWSASRSVKDIHSLAEMLRFAPHFALDGARLFGDAVLPVPNGRFAGVAMAVAVLAISGFLLRSKRVAPDVQRSLGQWLGICAIALAATAASYLIILPSVTYTPLSAGLENRGNLMASLPFTLAVYAIWVLAGILLAGRVTASIAVVALVALGAGYLVQLFAQERDWVESARVQASLLSTLRSAEQPSPEATLYVFGLPAEVAPGVTVFADTWSLNGAVRLTYGDPTLRAYPVLPGARVSCGPTAFVPEFLPGEGYNLADPDPDADFEYGQQYDDKDHGARYGRLLFLDATEGGVRPVGDQDDCLRAIEGMPSIP